MTPHILTPMSCPATAPTAEFYDELFDGGARAARLAFDVPAIFRTKYPSTDYWNFARPRPSFWHPAVSISERRLAAPASGWVYLLFTETGDLLYVGKTRMGVGHRLAHHIDEAYRGILNKHRWVPAAHHVVSLFTDTPETTEVDFIARFSPEHNKEFRSIRRSDTPSTLTDVLDHLSDVKGLPLRVDDAPPTRKTQAQPGDPMTREERVERAQEIRNERIAHYMEYAQQPRKIDGDVHEHPDGSVTIMAPPLDLSHWDEYTK